MGTALGVVIVEQRDNDVLIAAGNDDAEALRGLSLSTEQIRLEAQRYIDDCDQLPQAQPLLRSMVQQSLHAALSSIRYDHTGKFAGLAAGMDYSAPARTYYRDGYWTLQALLPLQPQIVLEEIHLMAAGLQPTGEAPSGLSSMAPVCQPPGKTHDAITPPSKKTTAVRKTGGVTILTARCSLF